MKSLIFTSVRSDFATSIVTKVLSTLLLVCALMCFPLQAAELTAEVDRTTVIDGESVVLYIEGTDIPRLPDTSALNANFRIIQSGQSTSQTIINGKSSRKVTLRFELQPKNLGSSIIPSFTIVGVSSDPITIDVVARGTPGVEPRDKVFAELSVDNLSPYVQEQVILSLQIFDDGNLVADPVLSGNSDYQIERLPKGRQQIVERNGVQYRVHTFRYALFPQQSGDITVDAITIPASIRDNSYTGSFPLFNTPTRRIELKSNAVSLTVKPRAAASTASWWLPVKSLELKHEWSSDISNAKTGEPLTLTLEMVATGATSTQLPEISVPDVPGVKIYVDNPEFGSQPTAANLLSARREKWSVIPNQSGPDQDGQLRLPEVVVKWWDTVADIERSAVIPAQQLIVDGQSAVAQDQTTGQPADQVAGQTPTNGPAPADNAGNNAVSNAAQSVASLQTENIDSQQDVESSEVSDDTGLNSGEFVPRHWLWIAVAAVTAWFATLFAWWWTGRQRHGRDVVSEKSADNKAERKAFKRMQSLARSQDAPAYSEAVLEWAQCHWPKNPVHNLPEIGIRLGHHHLTDTMRQLDRQRFSVDQQSDQSVSLIELQKVLEDALQHEMAGQSVHDPHALPQLYTS